MNHSLDVLICEHSSFELCLVEEMLVVGQVDHFRPVLIRWRATCATDHVELKDDFDERKLSLHYLRRFSIATEERLLDE